MSTQSQDEGSLKDVGSGIMLPASGNPFEATAQPAAPDVLAVDAERAVAKPPDAIAPPTSDQTPVLPPASETPAPRDLSPEDVMALFPSSHAERAIPAAPSADSALVAGIPAEAPASPSQPASSPPLTEPQPPLPPVPDADSTSTSKTAQAEPPAAPSSPPALSAPATAPGGQPPRGMRTLGVDAAGLGAEMSLDLKQDDIGTSVYSPGEGLAANPKLIKILVPDARLMALWLEIDALEAEVTATRHMSQKVAAEMLDRLMKARNLLMNDRAQFEEAARQVAEVKYHLTRFRSSTIFQTPLFISAYLVAFLIMVIASVPFSRTIAWDQLQIVNLKLDMLWYTMLLGGIGGFTGATYSLVAHVARDRDYDPQFALWYYQSPVMGLVLGVFVYIAVYILMNVGSVLIISGQATGGSPVFVLVTFFFAWLAGFKHNIAFDLADTVLKKLIPAQGDDTAGAPDRTVKPPSQK